MKQYVKLLQERQQKSVTKNANVLQARALVLSKYGVKDKAHLIFGRKID